MKIVHLLILCIVILTLYFSGIYFYLRDDSSGFDPENPFKNYRTIVKPPDTFDPVADCVTPFGTQLGVANNTPAFSNCASVFHGKQVGYYTFGDPYDVSEPKDYSRKDKFMTTTRYSALEYVVRWMALNRGVVPVVLEDVPSMWQQNYFYNPAKGTQEYDAEFIINYNDAGTPDEIVYTRPRPCDLLLYSADVARGFPRGHIAVVVAVKNDIEGAGGVERYKELAKTGMVPRILYLAEQNMDNKPWEHGWYSRTARFRWREPSRPGMAAEGYIEDDSGLSILGRMRVGAARVPRPEVNNYRDAMNEAIEEDL